MDSYHIFTLKRRSFLFVIDKNKEVTLRCLFIFSFAQERGDKRLHSYASCAQIRRRLHTHVKKRISLPPFPAFCAVRRRYFILPKKVNTISSFLHDKQKFPQYFYIKIKVQNIYNIPTKEVAYEFVFIFGTREKNLSDR